MSKYIEHGASAAGFHFFNLYQNCPQKFFLRFVLRLKRRTTATPLLFGAAFHAAKAEFYKTGDQRKALRRGLDDLRLRKSEFEERESYEWTQDRLGPLLTNFIQHHGRRDLKDFRFLGIEIEYKMPLVTLGGHTHHLTGRMDALVEDKRKNLFLLETKTSGYSLNEMMRFVQLSDQPTAYAGLVLANLKRPALILPDIAYWNRQSNNPGNIQCVRGSAESRSPERIEEFRKQTAQLSVEISRRVAEWKKRKADKTLLFPRNTFYCRVYAHDCEFASICWTNVEHRKKPPVGFIHDENIRGLSALGNEVEDLQAVEK